MLPAIKCTITENDKLLRSLTQIADLNNLNESLDKFETELNAAITQLIKDAGDLTSECNVDEEDDCESEDEDKQITPKKKKKT